MRAVAVTLLLLAGCSSGPVAPDDAGGDAGAPKDAGSDGATPPKDAGADAGGDAGKLDGYYAWGHSGAPNRLFIYYADAQNDLCFALHLESGTNTSALTLPMGWDLKQIGTGVFQSAQACTPYYSGNAQYQQYLSATGSVGFSGANVPSTIFTLDASLSFIPGWPPSSQDLKTTNLAVQMF